MHATSTARRFPILSEEELDQYEGGMRRPTAEILFAARANTLSRAPLSSLDSKKRAQRLESGTVVVVVVMVVVVVVLIVEVLVEVSKEE